MGLVINQMPARYAEDGWVKKCQCGEAGYDQEIVYHVYNASSGAALSHRVHGKASIPSAERPSYLLADGIARAGGCLP
jgi:hypothetical protein